jgi:hypothetical protein
VVVGQIRPAIATLQDDGTDEVLDAIYAPQDGNAQDAPAHTSTAPQFASFDWRYAIVAGIAGALTSKLIDYLREEYDR